MGAFEQILGTIVIMLVAVGFYFFPTIFSLNRHSGNTLKVALVNVLLGWTIIGYIVAMVMATRDNGYDEKQIASVSAASPSS